MKSSPLFILTVAFLATPFFMGQSAPGSVSGGGGCGCSDADKTGTVLDANDTITGDAANGDGTDGDGIVPTGDAGATGQDGSDGNGGTTDVCENADASGSVRTKEWTQDVDSFVGLPVSESCEAECGGSGVNEPWTISVHLKGSLLSDARSYSLSFMKEEWRKKVRYLEIKRDASDPDGCPAFKEDPCWKTCEDECVPGDLPLKDEEEFQKEAKSLALGYLNDVCKLELKLEDFDAPDAKDRIKAAFEKLTLTNTIQCAEGVALTASQVVPWVDQVLKAGLLRDEKGEPYTAEQIFKCTKRELLKD